MKKIEIVGTDEYGEKPYEISEMVGNSSVETIVHGYDLESALDNYVEHGEKKYGWKADEQEREGNIYFAKGYFPLDLDYLHISEVDKEYVNEIRAKRTNKQVQDMEMER